ncbi:hypothetical protein ABZ135_22130 [Streptomyces sp. NPDC006339]|uniref:hypothetical protein n=1 Tax=Streptomyces sp. NPDC006339 TaxID=3156755 RepID=UPI0033AEC1A3
MITLAASGGPFGPLGTGGIALAVAIVLVLGVRGNGRVKLTSSPAAYVGFIAATAAAGAGKMWAKPEQVVGQGLQGVGVGQGADGPFGDVGLGAVAAIILIIFLFAALTPVFGATLGVIAGFVWPAAGTGSIWAIPSDVIAGILASFGS